LDSLTDIRYPAYIKTRNLTHLAAEHGFVAPFKHRAVFDCLTMLRIASNYDINEIIARSKMPMVYVQACVSFDEKELAKARGYYWAAKPKIWYKALKEADATVEIKECGFRTAVLSGAPE
jgi:DNA polymerase-3 subunit epsilon